MGLDSPLQRGVALTLATLSPKLFFPWLLGNSLFHLPGHKATKDMAWGFSLFFGHHHTQLATGLRQITSFQDFVFLSIKLVLKSQIVRVLLKKSTYNLGKYNVTYK